MVTFKSGHLLVLYQVRCPMAPRFVFGPLSLTQEPKSPKKWLFYHKSESGAESESDNPKNSNGWGRHMTWGEWLFFPGSEDFKRPRTILASWKNPPNCYQHLKVPCSGMPFFRQKKQTNKQTKTKLNINRDIKEHNNNTRIYQYHGLGPLQRQKYPKSEQFQPNHSLGDFQQFCQKKSPRNVDIAPSMWQRIFSFFPHRFVYI